MNFIKRFYLKTNIHVALATTALVCVSQLNTNLPILDHTPIFVFLSTLWAYYFIRIFENCVCSFDGIVAYLTRQDLLSVILIFFSMFGSLYFGLRVGISKLVWVIPSALITLFYALPLFKYKQKPVYLRMFEWLKILSVALVWAIHTVLFPLQEYLADTQVWIEFLQRFFLILALMIPFEIKDLNLESDHITTLPQIYGVAGAKKLGFVLSSLFFLLSFLKYPLTVQSIVGELLVFVLTLYFIKKAKPDASYWFTGFWVEGVPIVWLLFVLLVQIFFS